MTIFPVEVTACMWLFCSVVITFLFVVRIYGKGQRRVAVVVLGDIGRSPRMQYHSLSLAQEGFIVDFIGYGGSIPLQSIVKNSRIKCHFMQEPPKLLQKFPKLMVYFLKVIWQSLILSWNLLTIQNPSHMLLQNPPAIPTLAVMWFVCLLRGSKLIVDWHNYGFTILGLAAGKRHPLVKFGTWYEHFFGALSAENICVTNAMKNDLQSNWNIRATTMYDRPPDMFQETSIEKQHSLFKKLSSDYPIFGTRSEIENNSMDETRFTEVLSDGTVIKKSKRPAVIISSTSWTEDEDFGILLKALEKYEENKIKNPDGHLSDLVCIITGKGPQKEYYTKMISQKCWKYIEVCTPWLEAEDYPLMLGSGDLGVCLHTSSSGLDLPMKVVDMFGCGLPVCAINFNCLNELVKHEENGMVFDSCEDLAEQLQLLLRNFPEKSEQLQKYKQNIKSFQKVRWSETWKKAVLPLFQ